MDVAHLEAFVTVVDLGSFTRAAARLRLSQPSVTNRVQALETEIGAKLLDRLYRSVSPTPAGKELLPLARDILRLTRLARAVAADDQDLPRGRISVGSAEYLTTFRLSPVIEHVYVNYPRLAIDLHRVSTDDAFAALRQGQLDCAFLIDTEQVVTGLESQTLCREPLSIICSPQHPLARADDVTRADLLNTTWVRGESAGNYHSRLISSLTSDGELPPRTFALESLEAAKRVVSKGVGIALMPSISVSEEMAEGALTQVSWRPQFEAFTQIAWRRDASRTPFMRKLIDDFVRILTHADAVVGHGVSNRP